MTVKDATRVTISDVARQAGVSRQTISNALQHPERVNPVTLDRVRSAIATLGYQPSSSAQSLRFRRAGAIGIELNTWGPRSHNETMAPFLGSLAIRAAAHACHMVPFGSSASDPMLHGYKEMRSRQLVDAFILADTHHDDPRPGWLTDHGIPFVAFGRIWDDPAATSWVDVDGAAGTASAVGHCRERGYRTVGYLGWPAGSGVGDERRTGWHDGCAAAGTAVTGPEDYCTQDLDDARRAARRLLGHLGPGDAIVCASDVLALGVHQVLLEQQRRIGTDLAVVGFDGSETARMHHLTTLAQPLSAIADLTLTLVHRLLDGAGPPPAGTILAPDLIVGSSTTREATYPLPASPSPSPTQESS